VAGKIFEELVVLGIESSEGIGVAAFFRASGSEIAAHDAVAIEKIHGEGVDIDAEGEKESDGKKAETSYQQQLR